MHLSVKELTLFLFSFVVWILLIVISYLNISMMEACLLFMHIEMNKTLTLVFVADDNKSTSDMKCITKYNESVE